MCDFVLALQSAVFFPGDTRKGFQERPESALTSLMARSIMDLFSMGEWKIFPTRRSMTVKTRTKMDRGLNTKSFNTVLLNGNNCINCLLIIFRKCFTGSENCSLSSNR